MSNRAGKTRPDCNQIAYRTMLEATGQAPKTLPPSMRVDPNKNPAAVALAKLGASKGGKARVAALSKRQRVAIAKKAVAARWNK